MTGTHAFRFFEFRGVHENQILGNNLREAVEKVRGDAG